MSENSAKETIRQFILTNFMVAPGARRFADDESFLKKGIIDSMGVMELLAFIQKRFGLKVESREVTPENFDSLDNLEKYIHSKTDGKSPDDPTP